VLVNEKIALGERICLTDNKRKIAVEICDDVRPGRTARLPLTAMMKTNS